MSKLLSCKLFSQVKSTQPAHTNITDGKEAASCCCFSFVCLLLCFLRGGGGCDGGGGGGGRGGFNYSFTSLLREIERPSLEERRWHSGLGSVLRHCRHQLGRHPSTTHTEGQEEHSACVRRSSEATKSYPTPHPSPLPVSNWNRRLSPSISWAFFAEVLASPIRLQPSVSADSPYCCTNSRLACELHQPFLLVSLPPDTAQTMGLD